jgi:hypothetical protein
MYSTFISMKTIENLAASKPPPNEANVLHSDLAKPTASPSSTSNISRFYPELLLPHTLALTKTLCAMSNLDILGHPLRPLLRSLLQPKQPSKACVV